MIQHFTKWFAVDDAKIAKMTADPAGGSAAYATGIDVPGIKTMQLSGSVDTKVLRGDNQKLDQNSILSDLAIHVEHAKVHLDVLSILLGSTVTDSGTTPNQKAVLDLLGTDRFPYWKIEGKTPADGVDLIGGDGHLFVWKAQLSSFPDLGFAEEDYRIVSFDASCSPRVADNKWIQALLNETAGALA